MSHDSGFRRSDRGSTHQPARGQQKRSKASRAYEDRLARRHKEQAQARKQAEESEQTEETDDS